MNIVAFKSTSILILTELAVLFEVTVARVVYYCGTCEMSLVMCPQTPSIGSV